ncbi:hypothetical protein Taro_018638, partial [Colocasia esculenta]|nr:hypothetical protein [Colocasia esculenta]
LAKLHKKNSRSKSTRPERQSINYEVDHVSQAINRGIPLPPNCLQISFPKQDQIIKRLKTFVVTYQRKEEKENARKTVKPIVFYKGELTPQASPEDDFNWKNKPKNHLEPIQDIADMPQNIKEMCKKQNIPKDLFNQLWGPAQVRGQPPFSKKNTRGLGYDTKVFFTVNTVELSLETSNSKNSQESSNSNSQEDTTSPKRKPSNEELSEESDEQAS